METAGIPLHGEVNTMCVCKFVWKHNGYVIGITVMYKVSMTNCDHRFVKFVKARIQTKRKLT